jgi:hypothetical protein
MAGKLTHKIEKVTVQVTVHSYDEQGQMVNEQTSQPMTCWRATVPDFWKFIDGELAKLTPGE